MFRVILLVRKGGLLDYTNFYKGMHFLNIMRIIKPIVNLMRYNTPKLMPQADVEFMRPIFENEFGQLSFYSPEDHLALWKPGKTSLRFQYSSDKSAASWVHGTIYAQEPRESFGEVDVVSFMRVEMLNPDEKGEIFDVIKNIVEKAGIEKVVANSSLGIHEEEYARRLQDIRGTRRLEHLKYGLGINVG